jgi:hypothetical protein
MKLKKTLCILFLILFIISQLSAAPPISIKVTVKQGKWTIKLDDTNLTGGAGSDFITPLESVTDKVSVDITKTQGDTAPWRLDISKTDTIWPSSVEIYARRTADGTGSGTISGGTTYQQITDIDQTLCTGTGDRTNITIQLKLENVSVVMGLDDYTTSIVYTVVET